MKVEGRSNSRKGVDEAAKRMTNPFLRRENFEDGGLVVAFKSHLLYVAALSLSYRGLLLRSSESSSI